MAPPKSALSVPSSRRRLRAVFAADIAGFSGQMSLNETITVSSLTEIRQIGRRQLEEFDGWLFGMAGDGLFATFESAIDAVQCALKLQLELASRPQLGDMPLRIGIHLGEVLINDDLPYGETLNIAARLEALADPGGILVSGTVMDAVSARIPATFEARGTPQLKNIPRDIPTFAVKPLPASETEQTARNDLPAASTSQVAPAEPAAKGGRAGRPTADFVRQITTALAAHNGPFALRTVERHMATDPSVFELISKLAEEIPNEDERLVFRVRASHINAASKTDDR